MSLFEKYSPSDKKPRSKDIIKKLVIRPARIDDISPISEIVSRREQKPLADIEPKIAAELSNPDRNKAFLLVGQIDDRVVGFGRATYFVPEAGAPANSCPEGWYLTGMIVDPEFRRQGIAHALTAGRLALIAEKASCAYYFANVQNRVSIELHDKFGFSEISRDFYYPGVSFTGGKGILFRVDLTNN